MRATPKKDSLQNYTDMVIFAKVVFLKSFSAAGDALGTTPSVVSKHIDRLEKSLGVRLLHRTTRKLSLTEAGLAIIEHCERMSVAADSGRLAATQFAHQASGSLRLSAPSAFGRLLVAPAIPDLLREHPGLSVELEMHDKVPDFVGGRLDMSITSKLVPGANLIAKRLTTIDWVVCASESYLHSHGTPQHPADLEKHNCVFFTSRLTPGDVWRFKQGDDQVSIRVNGNFRVNDSETVIQAVQHGVGVGLIPRFVYASYVTHGAPLKVLLPHATALGNFGPDIWLQFIATKPLIPKVRVSVDFLTARIKRDLNAPSTFHRSGKN